MGLAILGMLTGALIALGVGIHFSMEPFPGLATTLGMIYLGAVIGIKK